MKATIALFVASLSVVIISPRTTSAFSHRQRGHRPAGRRRLDIFDDQPSFRHHWDAPEEENTAGSSPIIGTFFNGYLDYVLG